MTDALLTLLWLALTQGRNLAQAALLACAMAWMTGMSAAALALLVYSFGGKQ